MPKKWIKRLAVILALGIMMPCLFVAGQVYAQTATIYYYQIGTSTNYTYLILGTAGSHLYVGYHSGSTAPPYTPSGIREAKAPAYALNSTAVFLTNPPAMTGAFRTTVTPSVPGAQILTDVSAASNTPSQIPFMIISGFIILAVSLAATWLMKRYEGSGSHFVKAGVIFGLMAVCVGVSLYDWWMLVIFGILAVALSWMSQQKGVY